MTTQLATRSSLLPIVSKCPGSLISPRINIDPYGDAAPLGTAVHEWLAGRIAGTSQDAPEAVAIRHGVDPDECARLSWSAWRQWTEEIPGRKDRPADFFPEPVTERELSAEALGLTLEGHPDVYSLCFPQIRLWDWKTGAEDDWLPQLWGYTWLLLREFPDYQAVHAMVGLVREQEIIPFRLERSEAEAWYRGLVQNLQDTSVFRPGGHCRYCPRAWECEARQAYLVAAMRTIAAMNYGFLRTEDSPAQSYADTLEAIRMITAQCEAARDLIRAQVALAGGTLPTGDGRELTLRQVEQHGVDVATGLDILRDELKEDLWPILKLTKKALAARVMARVDRGQKGAALADLMAKLDAAGAVTTTFQERLEIRRTTTISPNTKEVTA